MLSVMCCRVSSYLQFCLKLVRAQTKPIDCSDMQPCALNVPFYVFHDPMRGCGNKLRELVDWLAGLSHISGTVDDAVERNQALFRLVSATLLRTWDRQVQQVSLAFHMCRSLRLAQGCLSRGYMEGVNAAAATLLAVRCSSCPR
jgi:hypothetical protein